MDVGGGFHGDDPDRGGDKRRGALDEDNVVRFPKEWFGPDEGFVPIGSQATGPGAEPRPLAGDAFWSEDASVQQVLEPSDPVPGVPESRPSTQGIDEPSSGTQLQTSAAELSDSELVHEPHRATEEPRDPEESGRHIHTRRPRARLSAARLRPVHPVRPRVLALALALLAGTAVLGIVLTAMTGARTHRTDHARETTPLVLLGTTAVAPAERLAVLIERATTRARSAQREAASDRRRHIAKLHSPRPGRRHAQSQPQPAAVVPAGGGEPSAPNASSEVSASSAPNRIQPPSASAAAGPTGQFGP